MIKQLISLFNEIGCPALYIVQTSRAGDTVDNGMGVEFELREFAVIHEGNVFKDDKTKKIYDFQRKKNVEFGYFCAQNCNPSVEAFLEELKDTDGYEVVWKKEE